jgi:hypothetical protein
MTPYDVLKLLRERPFRPFRVHLSDGTSYEVRHPELAVVGTSTVFIGIPGPKGPDEPVEDHVHCALSHITRLQEIETSASAKS